MSENNCLDCTWCRWGQWPQTKGENDAKDIFYCALDRATTPDRTACGDFAWEPASEGNPRRTKTCQFCEFSGCKITHYAWDDKQHIEWFCALDIMGTEGRPTCNRFRHYEG